MGLIYTEQGRVLRGHNEELTRWRWAKKVLRLRDAPAATPADLWIMAAAYSGCRIPLQVHINGRPAGALRPPPDVTGWKWLKLPVPATLLRPGDNQIVLVAEASAMNSWVLAMENGAPAPRSYLSLDAGRTWQNRRMGAHGVLRGEYVVRLRRHDEAPEPRPPRIVYEHAEHPRVRELLDAVPAAIRRQRDPWRQLLALRTWVATRWAHNARGPAYCPWDPLTILAWARRDTVHAQSDKTAMCVHFAVLFAAAATALGHRARCWAGSTDVDEPCGHFVAEVFTPCRSRWVMHDANLDLHYEEHGEPMSMVQIADAARRGRSCARLVRTGPGFERQPPHMDRFFRELAAPGICYQRVGLWSRNDYVSQPLVAPPNHGSTAYCETAFVWYTPTKRDLTATAMFPHRVADRAWFERP